MILAASAQSVASTDGVTLAVFDLGGEGPLLLVAHATGFHGRAYDPLLERLDRYRRVTMDLRGHGDAQVPPGLDYRWESFAEDLTAVLDHLGGTQPAFGLGHSMGAACLMMVEQSRPGTFRGLFCYEPVIHPPGLREDPQRLEQWIAKTANRRPAFDSYEQAIANYRSKPPYSSFDPRALTAYVAHSFRQLADGRIHLKCLPEVEAQIYRMGPRHRTYEALSAIKCPVLLARGGEVQPGPGAWAEGIASQLPDGRYYSFDGLGHLGPLQDPQGVARVAADFFAELW